MRTLILAALACLIAAPAGAANKDLLKFFSRDLPIKVTFNDKVSDGCLPNPKAVETVVELGLRRAGLRPATADFGFWELFVQSSGYEARYRDHRGSGLCFAFVNASFRWDWKFRPEGKADAVYFSVPALDISYVLAGPKSDMQNLIRNQVAEIVDSFANEILKATEK